MLTLLALLISAPSIPGCRAIGASLHCELAPPVRPAPVSFKPPVPAVEPAPRRHHSRHHHRSHAAPRPSQAASDTPPTDADIRTHIASLAGIGDCSGVKAYATSVGTAASGDAAFRACLGQPVATTAPGLPPPPAWIARPSKP